MSLFRKLKDILNPKQEDRPYGLSEADVGKLRELKGSAGFGLFLSLLDKRAIMYGEGLLQAQTTEKMWEMRGYIMGLRAAGLIVDEILQKEKERSEHERSRSDGRQFRNDHRDTALYGTPSFSRS